FFEGVVLIFGVLQSFVIFEVVKDVGRNDLAALIDSSQEVAKKSLEKAAECVRCLEEDMAKARERVELQEFSLGSCPPSVGLQGMRWSTIGFDSDTNENEHFLGISQRVVKLGLDWDTNEMSILMLAKPLNGPVFLLVWRRDIHGDSINKAQLKDFWDQISDQSFDSRLRTVFDMVDKDADGRITEEEIKEIIWLSATTNKLSNIQQQAKEYAALIMEELDPEETGFIM
ncbi:hypothetical protein S245_070365, partial [Arachis hypogaea]